MNAATFPALGIASLIAVLSAPAFANVPASSDSPDSPEPPEIETQARPALDLSLPDATRTPHVDAAIAPTHEPTHDWVRRRMAPRVTHSHYEEAPNFPLEHSGNLLFLPFGGEVSKERR